LDLFSWIGTADWVTYGSSDVRLRTSDEPRPDAWARPRGVPPGLLLPHPSLAVLSRCGLIHCRGLASGHACSWTSLVASKVANSGTVAAMDLLLAHRCQQTGHASSVTSHDGQYLVLLCVVFIATAAPC
jgi:hypothetical protein